MSARLDDARAALAAIAAREAADPAIAPGSRTWWHLGESVAPRAVVLMHGFTNAPSQYALLGRELAQRGDALIVPRFPYHGYADRMSEAIAALRAADWQRTALEAVTIAARCGERVIVLGISVAGTLAAWLATHVAVDHAIAIAPFCGIRELPGRANDAFGAALRALPNRFLWWDPRAKVNQPPPHGYPRFSTHALGNSLQLTGQIANDAAAPHARRLTVVQNRSEPIVNNAYAWRRLAVARACGVDVARVWISLHDTHDVIEPEIPQASPATIYPVLLDLIAADVRVEGTSLAGG
ncbi:MAG TPA: hypothetical protein VMD91_09460 [Candidatus Sulfotelmatobacter sp.]|nr:hypothetical protein [Candidatus Sulfotelmatobacter sp.]